MPFIDLLDESEIFERDRAALGYVPNFCAALRSPARRVRGVAPTEGRDLGLDGPSPIRARDGRGGAPPPFDVVAAAAARCFFSKTLDALCIQADPVLAELDPELRDVLTVGRPIAANDA